MKTTVSEGAAKGKDKEPPKPHKLFPNHALFRALFCDDSTRAGRSQGVDATLTLSASEIAASCRDCSHMHDSNNSLPRAFIGLQISCSTN